MGIAERREREAQKMRDLILDTAMRLFLDNGVENVTIRKIAEKIEYSPTTIYLYFRNKKDILYTLHAKGFDLLYERQQSALSIEDPWEQLQEQGRIYIDFALAHPEYYDLMFIMRGPAKKIEELEVWESGLRSFELLKNILKDCMDAGYLEKGDEETTALAFWSLIHGLVSLAIRNRLVKFPEDQRDAMINSACDYILDNIRKA